MGSPAAHLGRVRITQATRELSRFSRRGLSRFSRSENGTVPFAYEVLRIALGLILLTAAALKGHQLATEPVAETSLSTSRWFLIGVVEFQLFFGLWLLSGLYPRRTSQAALMCFSAFACVSLYKALSGEASCGCFGRVPVNPWYTFILDLAAAAALVLCRATRHAETSPLPLPGEGPGVRVRLGTRLGWVLGIFLAAGIPAALAMGSYQAATVNEAGDIFGDSQFVVLEPENWVGKRFPLLNYIDIGDQLAGGQWIVVLYRKECPSCQEAVPKYERFARSLAFRSQRTQVALIEISSGGAPTPAETEKSRTLCARGRLDGGKEWFLEVRVSAFLSNAMVRSIAQGSQTSWNDD